MAGSFRFEASIAQLTMAQESYDFRHESVQPVNE